mmetsp:Transcript_18917/g.28012  ORF Transcript_18917/g.28012 Transcript_18917/m.28012 type:complete len:171 (-) Transcript_18917:37-549(-)|eukprot:CAMPEP_0194238198 /NCGR_PEP_ID=MMETSP0158-20130606/4995_1 /TAXON_ID=33649 /ORGANISM="Thalassionema nitzschioides, Strain L26-B" /LENGTH=170 /DNA_ID=CAMNT_0038972389 /DNA_START=36 /DNA_END=548 /DNA_ORIENTATION=-
MGFKLRKTIQSRRSGRTLGTCQMDLQFDNEKTLLPGQSMPFDMEIAHSCQKNYAIDEIRIRVHEVQQQPRCKKSRNSKVSKSEIRLPQRKQSKSDAVDIKAELNIPSSVLCDNVSTVVGPVVYHYLEVKLMSRGAEEIVRFKFPLAIGKEQYTTLSDLHHSSYPSIRSQK